jgi:hypothetical protein
LREHTRSPQFSELREHTRSPQFSVGFVLLIFLILCAVLCFGFVCLRPVSCVRSVTSIYELSILDSLTLCSPATLKTGMILCAPATLIVLTDVNLAIVQHRLLHSTTRVFFILYNNMKQARPWMLANLKIIWQFHAHEVVFVLCRVCAVLPVSMNCPFLIPSVFSIIEFYNKSCEFDSCSWRALLHNFIRCSFKKMTV